MPPAKEDSHQPGGSVCVEKYASMQRIVGNFHIYENRLIGYLDELAEL